VQALEIQVAICVYSVAMVTSMMVEMFMFKQDKAAL
jgi:hypothetical protein